MTYSQSVSLSWNKAPIWGLRPDFYYCQTVAGLLMWGAHSGERTGLSFTIAAGPRQCSHSRVRVEWDTLHYLTLSGSKLPFLSPPTIRRVTLEVFDPASTRHGLNSHSRTPLYSGDTDHETQKTQLLCCCRGMLPRSCLANSLGVGHIEHTFLLLGMRVYSSVT
jgi:hypothetical protein